MPEKADYIIPTTPDTVSGAETVAAIRYTLCAYQCAILQFPDVPDIPWQAVERLLGAPASNKYQQGIRTAIADPTRQHHIIFTALSEYSPSFNQAGKRTTALEPHSDSTQLSFSPNFAMPAHKREIPHFLLMAHVRHAARGGEAVHVPSAPVFDALAQQPDILEALMLPNAAICTIAEQQAIKPLVHLTETGLQLSFRDDDVGSTIPNPDCGRAEQVACGIALIKKVSRNPDNQCHFLLEHSDACKEVLLVQHRAALHGAAAYQNAYADGFSQNQPDYSLADIMAGTVGEVRVSEVARLYNDTDILPDSYTPTHGTAAAEFIAMQKNTLARH